MSAVVAAALAAVALWLSRPVRGAVWGLPAAASAATLWWAAHEFGLVGETIGLVVLAVLIGPAGIVLLRRRRRQVAALERASRVREVCEQLAADLAAGLSVAAALAGAAASWPEWEPVARTDRLGGSAAAAMQELADAEGAGDLRQVAGAWQLSQRSGAALAAALRGVALGLADQEQTRRVVRSELASARSTARLVTALPVATLVMGSGMGDPVGFLVGTPVGWACLASGLGLAVLGLCWLEQIAAWVEGEAW